MIRGHIEICKLYKDGRKETVLNDRNLVTKGLGQTFLNIQTGVGSTFIEDYSPRYFQLGLGANGLNSNDTSAFVYGLSSPFSYSDYGSDSELTVAEEYRGFNASSGDGGSTFVEVDQFDNIVNLSSFVLSGDDQYFAVAKAADITKYYMDSFTAEIILDENSANGKAITEVGLFARNPRGLPYDSPFLIAYKSFAAVNKTAEFSLVINWSVGFVGVSNQTDYVSTGNTDNGRSYTRMELK